MNKKEKEKLKEIWNKLKKIKIKEILLIFPYMALFLFIYFVMGAFMIILSPTIIPIWVFSNKSLKSSILTSPVKIVMKYWILLEEKGKKINLRKRLSDGD